jgi:cytochrome b561
VSSLTAVSGPVAGYNGVARSLHWLIVLLAAIVVGLAWAMERAPRNTPSRDQLMLLHQSVGLTILAVMILRIGWRWGHPAPPLPPSLARWERALSRATHVMLYVLFITMPVAGYLDAAAAGHAVSFFGLASIPPLIPANGRLSQAAIAFHLVGQYFVHLFVALHVAGALLHGIVKRDGVLERMLPTRGAI